MLKKIIKYTLSAGWALFLAVLANAQVSSTDSVYSVNIYFRHADATFVPKFSSNEQSAQRILDIIKDTQADSTKKLVLICYEASASPEASTTFDNNGLAQARLRSVRNWLTSHSEVAGIPYDFDTNVKVASWEEILTMAKADPEIPGGEDAIELIESILAKPSSQQSAIIKNWRGGVLFRYIDAKYFPVQRYCRISLTIHSEGTEQPEPEPNPVIMTTSKDTTATSNIAAIAAADTADANQPPAAQIADSSVVSNQPARSDTTRREPRRRMFRIGTNLAYDALTVANLSIEYGFCKHFSVGLRSTFSPWDITATLKFRTLLFEPEFRWYPEQDFTKHHIGLQGYFGWYNVAPWGSNVRYQDRNGDTPLYGAGLTYGYDLQITKNLGFDFSIGVGYMHLVYDCFYNVPNGALFNTDSREWFGPTELGVTFYYKF